MVRRSRRPASRMSPEHGFGADRRRKCPMAGRIAARVPEARDAKAGSPDVWRDCGCGRTTRSCVRSSRARQHAEAERIVGSLHDLQARGRNGGDRVHQDMTAGHRDLESGWPNCRDHNARNLFASIGNIKDCHTLRTSPKRRASEPRRSPEMRLRRETAGSEPGCTPSRIASRGRETDLVQSPATVQTRCSASRR